MATLKDIESLLDAKLKPVLDLQNKLDLALEKMEALENENRWLRDRLTAVEEHLDGLENQDRRNNVIIYGMQEGGDVENWGDTERKVIKIFQNANVTIDPGKIQRAHRLHSNSSPRPVIVKFSDYKEREKILREGRAAFGKDCEVRVTEDITRRARMQRRELSGIQETLYKGRYKVFFRRGDLYASGVVFKCIPETKKIEALTRDGVVQVRSTDEALSIMRKRPLSSPLHGIGQREQQQQKTRRTQQATTSYGT